MANTIYSQGDKVEYGIKIYYVDTEADKTNLPKRSAKMGSKCYVIEDKKWYILNGSYEWVPFVDAGGSGGSGSPFVPKGSVATVDELPTESNAIGDLYIVQENHSEWVWLTSTEEPDGYWEQIGSAILPSDIVEATEQMTNAQVIETRQNIGAVSKIQPEVYDAVSLLPIDGGNGVYLMMVGYEDDVPIVEILGTANDELVNIRGIADPYYATDAANKKYVDGIQISVAGTNPTIVPVHNHIYKCGELTSLTISNPPATGRYCIKFVSGATPTATVIPPKPAMKWQTDDNEPPQGFPAANTRYEINVDDTYVVLAEWPVPEVTP